VAKASPYAGLAGDAARLSPGGGGPGPPARGAVDDAIQRSDRTAEPRLKRRLKLFPRPVVHADLAAPAALAASHQQRSAARVEVGLGKGEGLAAPQAGAPEHDDQAAQPAAVDAVAGAAHHGDDLFDRRRVRGIADALVGRRLAGVEFRQRRVSDGGRRHRAATPT
jgi:hypothetical protein